MGTEEKLLAKTICEMFHYGVKAYHPEWGIVEVIEIKKNYIGFKTIKDGRFGLTNISRIKPYLRPISAITKEEAEEMFHVLHPNDKLVKVEIEQNKARFYHVFDGKHFGILAYFFNKIYSIEQMDWYYSKHFDVREILPLDLGIAVTEENNPYQISD